MRLQSQSMYSLLCSCGFSYVGESEDGSLQDWGIYSLCKQTVHRDISSAKYLTEIRWYSFVWRYQSISAYTG